MHLLILFDAMLHLKSFESPSFTIAIKINSRSVFVFVYKRFLLGKPLQFHHQIDSALFLIFLLKQEMLPKTNQWFYYMIAYTYRHDQYVVLKNIITSNEAGAL